MFAPVSVTSRPATTATLPVALIVATGPTTVPVAVDVKSPSRNVLDTLAVWVSLMTSRPACTITSAPPMRPPTLRTS
uniref:hypothetical protein n=1 Tax=Paraburkholderia caribensis TaxID=75105 RepID=UPI0013143052|nr:hypothetical protein [Paraburkholderia caribensis]